MSRLDRGMDGKDKALGDFCRGSKNIMVRGLFFILGAMFFLEELGDQGKNHAHAVLFV